MIQLADRLNLISESITLKVSAKANALKKAGVDVVGFGAGEPDFDTPTFVKDVCKTSLDKGATKYTPTPCIPELKAAIAEKFNKDNGLPYKPENITTGAGGKHCLYMAFMAVLNPGDEVLIPSPYWVSYPEQAKLAGASVKILPGDEAKGFRIFAATARSRDHAEDEGADPQFPQQPRRACVHTRGIESARRRRREAPEPHRLLR